MWLKMGGMKRNSYNFSLGFVEWIKHFSTSITFYNALEVDFIILKYGGWVQCKRAKERCFDSCFYGKQKLWMFLWHFLVCLMNL
jgi:hypothetical protein